MDRNQDDVEVELYEENVGNLNYSTPTGSRSSSPDRFLPVLSSQESLRRCVRYVVIVLGNTFVMSHWERVSESGYVDDVV